MGFEVVECGEGTRTRRGRETDGWTSWSCNNNREVKDRKLIEGYSVRDARDSSIDSENARNGA